MSRPPTKQVLPRRALVPPLLPPTSGHPTPRPSWRQCALDTPVRLLAYAAVILVRGDEYVVADVSPVVLGVLALDLAPTYTWRNGGEWPRRRERDVPGFTTVESLALAHGLAPTAAFHLPGLSWKRWGPPRVVDGDTTIGLADAFARLPRSPGQRAAAVAHVADIRALYGRMVTDIAYRIENSALFDSTVATTRQFETALAMWADVVPSTRDDEVIRRSAMVAVAFDTARAHAETVGLAHLPATAIDGARRAAGAARLATSSTSEAEREAARLRVASILDSLGLEHLPDATKMRRAITAGPPGASAPRRREGRGQPIG